MKKNIIKELNGLASEFDTCSNVIPKFLLKKITNQIVSGVITKELILEYFQCLIPSDIQLTRNRIVRSVSRNEPATATHPLMATDLKL